MKYDYEILSRWGHLYPGLQLSGQEMHAKVEEALKVRAIPGAQISRVKWKEGGRRCETRLRQRRRSMQGDECLLSEEVVVQRRGW